MRLLVLSSVVVASTAFADFGFPDWVKFPPQVGLAEGQELVEETYADVEVPTSATVKRTVRGHQWTRWLLYTPKAGEKALGFYNGSEERIGKALEPALKASGWTKVFEAPEHTLFGLTQKRDGKKWSGSLAVEAPTGQLKFTIVEEGSAPTALTLVPPGKSPESVADDADLPFLPPPPGSTRQGGGHGNEPLDVTLPGKTDDLQLVGNGSYRRSSKGPSTLSALDFTVAYRSALTAAGWTIVWPSGNEVGKVIAHFTKNGRDVWAVLDYEYGANLSFTVADVGGEDWASRLSKECELPLVGVTFDFDKATLKPESAPLLEKAAAALKVVQGEIEVQGHTDAKGGAEYNQKLSAARAQTVLEWLGAHGVAAKRLSARGYGLTQPIADNDTELGRAKNRRVQLVRKGCAK